MKAIRQETFETNSSSTHSLAIKTYKEKYLSPSSTLVVDFINTDDCYVLSTLKEKVSYLVSQIVDRYKYDVYDYDDLKEQVERDYDFQRIADYVMTKFNKKVVLPKSYKVHSYVDEDGDTHNDLDEIVNINHQIRYTSLEELLEDLVTEHHDLLDDVLSENTLIEFGRD